MNFAIGSPWDIISGVLSLTWLRELNRAVAVTPTSSGIGGEFVLVPIDFNKWRYRKGEN